MTRTHPEPPGIPSGGDRARQRASRGRRSARGFSLVELLLVLFIIGLAAAAISAGLLTGSVGAKRRSALSGVVTEVAAARIEAMRTGRAVAVALRLDDGAARLRLTRERGAGEPRAASWPAAGLVPLDESLRRVAEAEARFAPTGRSGTIRWILGVSDGVGGVDAGRIWRIEFDPVSGAVSLAHGGAPTGAGTEVLR